tara:strand:- start:1702 stop:2088 length:387 start_codon:yes stop_codon:yes gene_type:complete
MPTYSEKLFTTLDKVMFLWYIIVMKPRNIIRNEGGEPFTVHQHIILKNFWEYYLGETDKDGVAFGYVMGVENEWGSVYLPEIEPYIIGRARANDLWHIMPPEGYYWEDENEEVGLSSHTAYEKNRLTK